MAGWVHSCDIEVCVVSLQICSVFTRRIFLCNCFEFALMLDVKLVLLWFPRLCILASLVVMFYRTLFQLKGNVSTVSCAVEDTRLSGKRQCEYLQQQPGNVTYVSLLPLGKVTSSPFFHWVRSLHLPLAFG